ncbi:hypothetical protein L6164_034979 [Bauhinia variegata]|uniref:Uncharacterized protein n=1 Tax=Bauhinia variegata TaxID=167791 RepID=A0ACB9KXE9_BAUVA|nr:hypothetical protein L6164_034979 [Bauhinia variegata]
MVRGGKVSRERNCRGRVRSKGKGSDDSDEDYVVSDDDRYVSDGSEDYCSSLDECASEESFNSFVDVEVEDEEEEIEGLRKINRLKTKNGFRDQQKGGGKTPKKRRKTTYAQQLDDEEEDGVNEDEDQYEEEDDEDFDFDDDEEFTPEEEEDSDEEEEIRGRKKRNNSMKMGKKALQKRVSVTSTRGRKRRRRSSRVAREPLKNRRKNAGLRRKVRCNDEDDFIDEGSAVRTKSKKKPVLKKRRLSDSDSDCVFSSDYEFTISEEEREQVREAEELCVSLRPNLRSSLFTMKNEDDGVQEDLHRQRKPPGRKGKEKIEEAQGKKGKEKVEDLKSEVVKQVCGICLSEEDRRRVRGVLNCCTHFFCFACIMEWSKVETRCPLCKQRFTTISKPGRQTPGVDLREVVIQVPERDQVYQPSEEELRSYIDPYESVICSECHQGGDDALMLLCDLCDSPAHTYCVGLGRVVPEGNWYCDGCRPVALGSSSSQVQEHVSDPRVTLQSLPCRPSHALHVRESIDLNLISSPRSSFNQVLGNLSASRFSGRSLEGVSPLSGGGVPTLTGRRWIQRQIQQLLSMDRINSRIGRINGISATSSNINLHSSQIDQSTETATQHTRMQDVGTSYHTFLEDRLCNDSSPLIQNGDVLSMRISNSRRTPVQDSTTFTDRTVNGTLWPGLLGTPPPQVSDYEQVHQLSSRSNTVTDGSISPAVKEESRIAKEQLRSMVKSHLNCLSRDICLSSTTFKDIVRSCTHTILAACGFEHKKSEVCSVPPLSVCSHIQVMTVGTTSLLQGCCSSCFDSFLVEVVKRIMDTKLSSGWLRLGL